MNIIINGTTVSNAGEFEKRLETTLQRHEDNKQKLALLQQRVAELQEAIALKHKKRPEEREGNIALASKLAVERTELSGITETKKKMAAVFDQIKGLLACTTCKKVALLPLLAGPCGHVHCQSCLVRLDEVVAKEMEKKAAVQQDSVLYLSARKCLCTHPILGKGIPVIPLKAIGNLLAEEGLLSPSEMEQKMKGSSYDLHLGKGVLENALGIAAWTSLEIAKKSAQDLLAKIDELPWKKISILFAHGNEILFNTFVSILSSEKKLLVSKSSTLRMIVVIQNPASFPDANTVASEFTINVETTGCFTIKN